MKSFGKIFINEVLKHFIEEKIETGEVMSYDKMWDDCYDVSTFPNLDNIVFSTFSNKKYNIKFEIEFKVEDIFHTRERQIVAYPIIKEINRI